MIGEHEVYKVPNICRWQGPDIPWPDESGFGCGGVKRWVLRLDGAPGSALLLLTRVDGPLPTFWVEYELPVSSQPWQYLGSNRMVIRAAHLEACVDWPLEIWVSAVLT